MPLKPPYLSNSELLNPAGGNLFRDLWDQKLKQNGLSNQLRHWYDSPRVRSILTAMEHCDYRGNARQLFIEAKICELLAIQLHEQEQVSDVADVQHTNASAFKQLGEVKDYIDNHFLEKLSLRMLSREFGINECKLKQRFKTFFGTTVFGYIRELKMNLAKKLLRENKFAVFQVANTLGYKNAHHFSAAFKKFTGFTPAQWQSELSKNSDCDF